MYNPSNSGNQEKPEGLDNLVYPLRPFADLGLKIKDLGKGGFLKKGDYLLELLIEGFDDLRLQKDSKPDIKNIPNKVLNRDVLVRMYQVDLKTCVETSSSMYLNSIKGNGIHIENDGSYKGKSSVFMTPVEIDKKKYVVDFTFKFIPTAPVNGLDSQEPDLVLYEWVLSSVDRHDVTENNHVQMIEIGFPEGKYFSVPGNSPAVEILHSIYLQKAGKNDAIARLKGRGASKN